MFANIVVVFLLGIAPALAIWPVPTNITTGNSTLWVAHDIMVTYNGGILPWVSGYSARDSSFSSKDIVTKAVSRAMGNVLEKNFVPWKLYARNQLQSTEPSSSEQKTMISRLEIQQTAPDGNGTWKPQLAGKMDESYSLSVDLQGVAKLTASSAVGVLRGLETFTQLFYKHSSSGAIYTTKAPVDITDAPKFPHRGILMDVARNWYPIENIFRTLDAMSWSKLNRLHIHVTDSQSWPLEIPSMPELSEKGAYGKGLTYSPADIAEIQTYAIYRGVEVIFEIDTPGHIGIIAESHPDVITGWGSAPWTTYCAEPPCGQFRLNDSCVDDFLDKLMDDLMPRLSPYTAYFHTGGDEVNFQEYLLDPSVGTNDSAVIVPLLQAFTDKNHARVRKEGLAPIVWEEIPKNYNVTISDDVVVQSWLGGDAVKWLTSNGHQVIDSNYNYWYLDCGRGAWLNFGNGDAFDAYYPFNDWCGPTKSWQLVYQHDPIANLTEEEAKLVLGGEVAVWSETIDETNIDTVIWPRASAMGEVLWSGRYDAAGQNRSQLEASPRLNELRERMVARGVRAAPIQMVFCQQGMNASACEFPM